MRILVHIGMPHCGAEAMQSALGQLRPELLRKGVLYSGAAGRSNHSRLYMAVSDPDRGDPLRHARGFASPPAQEKLRRDLARELAAEAARHPDARLLLFSAPQLATLPDTAELERLRALLAPLSDDITILAHLDEQARILARFYAEALRHGRLASLQQELSLAASGAPWAETAIAGWGPVQAAQDCAEIQGIPHWLDYPALLARWQQVFGAEKVILRPHDPTGAALPDQLCALLGLKALRKKIEAPPVDPPVSAVTLARWRQLNAVLARVLATGRNVPRPLWRGLLAEASLPGPPVEAGALAALSRRFQPGNRALVARFPDLADCLGPEEPRPDWTEPAPGFGFRATQYVAAILPAILEATAARPAEQAGLSPAAERLLSDKAKEILASLKGNRFAPHDRIGPRSDAEATPFAETTLAPLPAGKTGKVILACMKNEAPYILEWIAYHRQIGVDNFLIYTNDCSDGTDALLDRLQDLGLVQHRPNGDWKGNSPQQHALNKALREEMVRNADWLIHIDVDEFINVRAGNGTLDDFLACVPDATNVAMTWRMFGNNRVERFEDRPVIAQFDHAAPRYCPKPHTSWGFKTMTRNSGVYGKLSCHRPNKRNPGAPVQWVNGSGKPMPARYHDKGWRSDPSSVGYDMLQLNHYALRSAESFLIKRQRGRALHVDRSIGLNYWVRMDWSQNRDVTIMRNLPRLAAETARLMADPEVKRLHLAAVDWHRAKAAELRDTPEFAELLRQAQAVQLDDLERAAMALALEIDG